MAHIFLPNIHSYVGYALIDELRNDHTESPHNVIVGTSYSNSPCPSGVSEIVSVTSRQQTKPRNFRQHLQQSDLVVLDLVDGDLEEAEAVLRLLSEPSSKERVVICLSTPMSWQGECSGADWRTREVAPQFDGLKALEAMALGTNTVGLKTYVLVPGVLFGNGEETFKYHLETSWLEDPPYLVVVGDGRNIVPTLHVRDFAKAVARIFEQRPSERYLVCAGASYSQLELVSEISSLGTGSVRHTNLLDLLDEDWTATLSMDTSLVTSSCFHTMDWHCRSFIEGLETVRAEFNLFRGLKQLKVFVTGPPASGKTSYSALLSSRLNLPHIHVAKVAQNVTQLESALGQEVRTKLEELKTQMIADAEKHKKKNQELDYSKFLPRIPDDLLAKAFHWQLCIPQVKNRGFVLDGWPRNFNDSVRFKETADWSNIKPDVVVVLTGPNEVLIQRAKELGPERTAGTHYTDEGMKRRLGQYKDFTSDKAKTLKDFFREEQFKVIEVDLALPTLSGLEVLLASLAETPLPQDSLHEQPSAEEESKAKFLDDQQIGQAVQMPPGLDTLIDIDNTQDA
jgi:adenylate kinase